MLLQKQEVHGVAEEIQNTGVLQPDAEEGVQHRGDERRNQPKLGQGQHGQNEAHADDRHIPQGPQPQGGLGFQVVGVDVDSPSPPENEKAAQ